MATIKEMLTANTADILEATELLKVLGDREGQFVWKQLTAQGGDFIAFVTADDENSYPNKGTQDGHWYERVTEGIPYTGANPLTIGEAGATIPANTLLEEALQILNGVEAGVSGIDYGTFVAASSVKSVTFNHNLGATPRLAALLMIEAPNTVTSGVAYIISGFAISFGLTGGKVSAGMGCTSDSTTLTFGASSALVSGKEFAWVAIA